MKSLSAGLLLGGVALFAGGCVVHETVAYRSGPYAGVYYDYYYYPDCNVYYYPSGGMYFWYSSGRWVSGASLPTTIVINESSRQSIRAPSRQPWMHRHP